MIDRIFSGVFPGGIVYADRQRERGGDYARLAFLPFHSLELDIKPDCPTELAEEIRRSAAAIIARRGDRYPVSASQFITLGKP